MRIADLLSRSRPTISFEFMAPRDETEVEVLERTIAALAGHAPDWVSVTYRVSTGDKTLDLVTRIKRQYHIESMAHLTCANSADRTRQILNWMVDPIEILLYTLESSNNNNLRSHGYKDIPGCRCET